MFEVNKPPVGLARGARDPFALLRQMASEFDWMFDDVPWVRRPALRSGAPREPMAWSPKIDVFEKDKRLVTRIDLPGMKKEDVLVEVVDGQLAISGERRREIEEDKDNLYRVEREYGSFRRTVPLPEGVKLQDVKATFTNGVLEVSMPLPASVEEKPTKITIEEKAPGVKSAA